MIHRNRCRGAEVLTAALALVVSGCYAARGSGRERLRARKPLEQADPPAVVIRKPLTDDRIYEYAVLDNGLKVLAVEDAKTAKAGFGIAVEAGSFYDPPALPGLAHFCEHLLFLGTRKYPDEASFDVFMSQHDGMNNAYTEEERTVFYNEVGHAGFDEGLDRFAQFFIAPLFKADMVGRELNAVNSEHEKNIPDQSRRLWQVLRGTAGQSSVLGRFYTGTTESLHNGDVTTVAALRKYHEANYCAPRMSLVMISNLPAAEQLEAGKKHFADIPRGSCGAPKDFGEEGRVAFEGSDHIGQFIQMGTKSTPSFWMMFPLEPTLKLYKEAPAQYLEYVLDYAGPHSLSSWLKRQGLITELHVEMDQTSAATLTFLQFELTPQGAKEESVKEIAGSTFAFLRLLNEEAEAEVSRVYESLQQMSSVDFDYSEAPDSMMDFAAELAAALSSFAPQDVLTASNGVVSEVNTGRVQALLAALANPSGMSMALATPDFKPSRKDLWEQYYGIAFRQEPIPQDWISSWSARGGSSGLCAVPALHYVPTALAVGKASAGKYPQGFHVRTSASAAALELWWKGQGSFALPKVQLFLRLGRRAGHVSAELAALKMLHAELVTQVLEEPLEDFRNCGLDHVVKTGTSSYIVQVGGYDQHSGALLLQVLEGLLEVDFDARAFARAHRQVLDRLVDTSRHDPYELAEGELGALTVDAVFSREEILQALEPLDEQKLHSYLAAMHADGLRAQLLVVGNMDKASATKLAGGVLQRVSKLEGGLIPAESTQGPRVLAATKPLELRMKNPIPGDINHVTVTSYQYGVPDLPARVRLLLLGKMISGPIYDTLRTKKQLGYVVFGFVAKEVNVLDLRVLVQGSEKLPDDVDAEIEKVVESFGVTLQAMKQKEFLTWKTALKSELQRPPQNMNQEADRYWAQIVNDARCFNRRELALQYLEKLESADAVFETFQSLRTAHRKVSVKMFGGSADPGEGHSQQGHSQEVQPPQGTQLLFTSGVSTSAKQQLAEGFGFYPTLEHCTL